jgi:hypothetical protein
MMRSLEDEVLDEGAWYGWGKMLYGERKSCQRTRGPMAFIIHGTPLSLTRNNHEQRNCESYLSR